MATASASSPTARRELGRPIAWRWLREASGLLGMGAAGLANEPSVAPACPQGPPEDPGIAPRALQSLFQEMGAGGQQRVTLSMVEIYNEAVRSDGGSSSPSLLRPGGLPFPPSLALAPSPQGPAGPWAPRAPGSAAGPSWPGRGAGGRPHPVGRAQPGDTAPGKAVQETSGPVPHGPGTQGALSSLPTLQMLSLGRSNRATAATAMNQHSSRSHALVTLTLSPPCAPGTAGTSEGLGAQQAAGRLEVPPSPWPVLLPAGTLHLVDLAGSERAWKTGAAAGAQRGDPEGARRLREAQTINRSLLALGGVMAALRARRPHVPFRDSQLTRLLQPALGPGTTAVLLLQVGRWGPSVCGRQPTWASPPATSRPPHPSVDLHAARGPRGDGVLTQVRRESGPGGAGSGPAPQDTTSRDTLVAQHGHCTHPHTACRQPSQPQLGPDTRRGWQPRLSV